MSINARRTLITAKVESSYGTDPTPTGSSNAIDAFDFKVIPLVAEKVTHNKTQTHYGAQPSSQAGKHSKVTFSTYLQGAGAAGSAPAWGPLLRACGFAETLNASTSAVYNPVSTAHESATIYFYEDGMLYKLKGARGNATLTADAQNLPMMAFEFWGLKQAITDAAMASPTLTGWKRPVIVNDGNTDFTLFSYAAKMKAFTLNFGNVIEPRFLVGSEAIMLPDRSMSGQVTIEQPTVAEKDYQALIDAETTGAFTLTHGVSAGYIVEIAGPALQLQPTDNSADQGYKMLTIPFDLLPSSGNDELTITAK